MIAKYAARVKRLPGPALAAVIEELELYAPPGGLGIVKMVERSGLGTADVVLALLRRGMRSEAEAVAGVPVLEPSRVAGKPVRVVIPEEEPPAPPVAWEHERLLRIERNNPRVHGSNAWDRFEVAQGLARRHPTREALMARGITRRDMREWERRGWAEFGR